MGRARNYDDGPNNREAFLGNEASLMNGLMGFLSSTTFVQFPPIGDVRFVNRRGKSSPTGNDTWAGLIDPAELGLDSRSRGQSRRGQLLGGPSARKLNERASRVCRDDQLAETQDGSSNDNGWHRRMEGGGGVKSCRPIAVPSKWATMELAVPWDRTTSRSILPRDASYDLST